MRILILCTGNSCRSQMAAGFLKSFDRRLDVHSAGTSPSADINARAITVMAEAGLDISAGKPKSVENYLKDSWDYVITVCDDANETCPFFPGKVKYRMHLGFEDPSHTTGKEEFIMGEFRRIRDQIKFEFQRLYNDQIKSQLE